MIELFFWPTPNGMKPLIFLHEVGLEYELTAVDINKGDQFTQEFLEIAPNGRIPAIIDHAPAVSEIAVSVFESGAILIYLAEKTGQLLPQSEKGRTEVLEWVMWQMAGLGPMLGQNHHFNVYAPQKVAYAIKRYNDEASRLYAVLDLRLAEREYICSDYTISDIVCYPWIARHERHQINLDDFPSVKRWFDTMSGRPAVRDAYNRAEKMNVGAPVTDASKSILFGQTAETVRGAVSKKRS
ncbi:MAG TPA: thiol:disulfide oxidoreductase [Gammaproteobacteria bacterium]|jgi:GST-like protein|nr:MAG: thiol:disulfide oxidoreductase [Candidatus Thioglobus sp. MED-G23]RPG02630.1 MAG: thiol:disulfide oxidoreductase [Proteobacteria bacterium TMED51]HAU41370.1 thiol:disulfide oxidoreductase [Gammaproteobacteria bacterium]HCL94722.1 thiol:disulfide oxidoreductase [Gammaproteobacteria bacterium]|tara:strand:- start:21560 stop:22279 length:720 start_codon:yes stop_codon:yes gene_type:complete